MKKIKILDMDTYLDGGSVKLITDAGEFTIDGKIKTRTRGVVYCGKNGSGVVAEKSVVDGIREELQLMEFVIDEALNLLGRRV